MKPLDFLKGKFQAQQLGHAYLFSGSEQIGKKETAKEFTQFINCMSHEALAKGGSPCKKCQNCNLIEKEQYPDLLVVKSANSKSSLDNEKDMMEIDVVQIRDVNNFLSYKAYYGGYKAVIIENADRMNQEAQSCFLKTLEEPKGKTIIFLLSSKPEILLPTIFSRCQTLTFFNSEKHQETSQEKKELQELLHIVSSELATKFQYTKKVNLEGENFSAILKTLQRHFRNILLSKIGVGIPVSENNYSIEKLKNIIRLIEKLHTQVATTNASP